MTLPTGVDQPTLERCYVNHGIWQPGQQAECRGYHPWSSNPNEPACGTLGLHLGHQYSVPPPKLTAAILMRILLKLGECDVRCATDTDARGNPGWQIRIWPCDPKFDGTEIFNKSFDAAIIFAGAARESK